MEPALASLRPPTGHAASSCLPCRQDRTGVACTNKSQIGAVTGRSPVSPQAATPAWHHPDDVVSERILEVINFPLDGIDLFVRLADALSLIHI